VTNAAGEFIAQAKDPEARDEATMAKHRAAGTDPWEANGRLIAAAPELLEKARAVLTFYDRAELPHMPGEAEMLDALSLAISKAEGRWGG
jgi:hypothetical protein